MVRTVRMLAAAAAAALTCLAGCNLGVGIFPDRLMSYEAYADLERFIDPEHVWDYGFQIVRDPRLASGYPEYLVLASDDGSFGDDCVVIFDADLRVLGHYTRDQLDAMDAAHPYSGHGAMVDASGRIVVGNRRFAVSSRAVSYLDTPADLCSCSSPGLAVPEEASGPNLANLHGDLQNLVFDRYDADWGFLDTKSLQIGTSSSHSVEGAWLTDTQVLLVVRHGADPTDTAHVLAMDRLPFSAGTVGTPLRATSTAGIVPSSDDLEWRTLGYTDEGFAAFRWSTTPEYCLFNESGAVIATSDPVPESKQPHDDQRHVYGRTSGWYILNMRAMSLERRAWWWK